MLRSLMLTAAIPVFAAADTSSASVDFENTAAMLDKMAQALNQDENIGDFFEEYIEAGETVKMGPLTLLHYINDTKNPDGSLKFGLVVDNLPRPQRQGEKGNTSEKVTVEVMNPKTNELKSQTISAYVYLADHLDEGKKINRALDEIAKLPKSEAKARDFGKWDQRKRAYRKVVRDMGRLYYQFYDLAGCPLVKAEHAKIEKLDPATNQVSLVYDTSSAPIKIVSTQTGEAIFVSVANFLRYDVQAAIEKAGEPAKVTKAHLEATLKRESDKGKGTPASLNKETAYASLLAEAAYLANDDNFATEQRLFRLKDKAGQYTQEANERLLAWADFSDRVDGLLAADLKRITDLRNARNARDKAEQKTAA